MIYLQIYNTFFNILLLRDSLHYLKRFTELFAELEDLLKTLENIFTLATNLLKIYKKRQSF